MKKVLITGASGFVGSHLIEYLLQNENMYEIHGTYNSQLPSNPQDNVTFHQVNFLNKDNVNELIKNVQPEVVYHLAGQASIPDSIKNPVETFHINVDSQLNLFTSLLENKMLDTKILLITSADVYGLITPEDLPVDEETPFRPANPYAVSKITQDYLGQQFYLSYKLPVIRVRPYNHIGTRQSPKFVVSDFAKQTAEIEKNKREPILMVGNLESRRDFTDVRDIVRAYVAALEKGDVGDVYNIGSGVSHSVSEILDMLLSLSTTKIEVKIDHARFRPAEVPEVVCDVSKFHGKTGWKPEISLDQTIKETLDYWRNIV
jgi:GDP-4-dehydro-6-deoxy-D-mannose reductase